MCCDWQGAKQHLPKFADSAMDLRLRHISSSPATRALFHVSRVLHDSREKKNIAAYCMKDDAVNQVMICVGEDLKHPPNHQRIEGCMAKVVAAVLIILGLDLKFRH